MPHKHLLFRDEARSKILKGAARLADAVRVTLGPKAHCVLLERKWGSPLVCDDGVTIAREVDLEDAEENLGARMLREAAVQTGDAVGDGTTTATVLAHAIFAEGLRNVVAGASAVDLKRGLERGLARAVEAIRAVSRPVASSKERAQVATISAHGDTAVGDLVAEALDRVGGEGIVSVEEAKGTETTLDVVEGMRFDRGYLSPYFVTDAHKMTSVLEEPLILLYEKRLAALKDIVPLLEHAVREGRALLVVAEEVEGDALATLVVNRVRGSLRCAAAKAPGFGDRRKAMLEDVATLTGGQLISEDLGMRLEKLDMSLLGTATRVVLTREDTTIIGGGGTKSAIEGRCAQIRAELEKSTSDYDKEKLEERLARLAGGVAVIRVGAPSEAEMKNRKDAFDDAIASTKAAAAEGVVPGGGLVLLRARSAVLDEAEQCAGDMATGIRILARSLEAPTRQIARNSGVDEGIVIERMSSGKGALGFDASTGAYVDLVAAGIIDPTKVVRLALENAVSVAGTLLLAEATLTEVEEKEAAPTVPDLD